MRAYPQEYAPRNPADSLPYEVVAAELETFLAGRREREREVPGFVEHKKCSVRTTLPSLKLLALGRHISL